MADLRLPALAALAGLAWLVGLWRLGLYTDPAVRSWRRLARLRGLELPVSERLGQRLPFLRRLQTETDLGRLLSLAGRRETPAEWLLRTAARAGIGLATMLLLDQAAVLATGHLGFPLLLAPALAAVLALLAYARLRRRAQERRQRLGLAVADSLPHLAVLTHHHRLPPGEALLLLARCQPDGLLRRLLAEETTAPSTAAAYERLGSGYEIPALAELGAAIRRVTERGLSGPDVYTGLARTTYAVRLARARVAAAQARTLIVIPMGLMIVPVLILIGAPLVASLTGIFAR